jgi:hypothetical protein
MLPRPSIANALTKLSPQNSIDKAASAEPSCQILPTVLAIPIITLALSVLSLLHVLLMEPIAVPSSEHTIDLVVAKERRIRICSRNDMDYLLQELSQSANLTFGFSFD